MMSPEVLRAVNDEIAAEAARKGRVPYIPEDANEPRRWPPFPFPNLGSYVPPGWEVAEETFFVDKTGHGYSWEPALTWEQFKSQLVQHIADHPDHGFAVIEEGPFQVVVAAMQRVRSDIADRLNVTE